MERFQGGLLHGLVGCHVDVAVTVAVCVFRTHGCSEGLESQHVDIDEEDFVERAVVDGDDGDGAVSREIDALQVEVEVWWDGWAQVETRQKLFEFGRGGDPL